MITCKIIIAENVNGLCISMEPDNRDGSKRELIIASIMDFAIRTAHEHINSSIKHNTVLTEGEMCEDLKKKLLKKWPEIK